MPNTSGLLNAGGSAGLSELSPRLLRQNATQSASLRLQSSGYRSANVSPWSQTSFFHLLTGQSHEHYSLNTGKNNLEDYCGFSRNLVMLVGQAPSVNLSSEAGYVGSCWVSWCAFCCY
ncbi:hypothetical protein EWB00_007089 [Schistosoma japonicum]|uniref:Uncharacterized protein n=1 Tax=Schistosoma japonicum TaxID=6182 RepID=A0A4Z2DSW4_SCHJA|nr:hypothetical protein EWB00_007089 [Schistosoma japonicum]TNN19632.1 hypothetical protein EWB00_007089 [Schistosoma japonicum]TNN19633.1 hypothetical protein EWB00_007089 [Schistosoma japonicum]TNN19634.1 hypothetical protein EWB00_007089 [Schistosoma japonicum]